MKLREVITETASTRKDIMDKQIAEINARRSQYESELERLYDMLEDTDSSDKVAIDNIRKKIHSLEHSIKLAAGEIWAAQSAYRSGNVHDSTVGRMLRRK